MILLFHETETKIKGLLKTLYEISIPAIHQLVDFLQEFLQFAVFRVFSFFDQADQFLALLHQFVGVLVLRVGILLFFLIFPDLFFLFFLIQDLVRFIGRKIFVVKEIKDISRIRSRCLRIR